MKLAVKIVTLLVAILAAGTTTVAAEPALVDDVQRRAVPATPFPDITPDKDAKEACGSKTTRVQAQQVVYDLALRSYLRVLDSLRRAPGSVSPEELRKFERALYLATIALNDAKFAEATCFNKEGKDPKKVCVELVLELNRLDAELKLRAELANLARQDRDAVVKQFGALADSVSLQKVDEAQAAATLAELKHKEIGQLIAELGRKLDAIPECNDFPRKPPKQDKKVELPVGPADPIVSAPAEQTVTTDPTLPAE